jgi:hypothetical protein
MECGRVVRSFVHVATVVSVRLHQRHPMRTSEHGVGSSGSREGRRRWGVLP